MSEILIMIGTVGLTILLITALVDVKRGNVNKEAVDNSKKQK